MLPQNRAKLSAGSGEQRTDLTQIQISILVVGQFGSVEAGQAGLGSVELDFLFHDDLVEFFEFMGHLLELAHGDAFVLGRVSDRFFDLVDLALNLMELVAFEFLFLLGGFELLFEVLPLFRVFEASW